jgi:hypothetical protein
VGDGLSAKWRRLEFRNWGLVELRNYELSIRGLPVGTYLGFCGFAVQGAGLLLGFWGSVVHVGVLGYCWAGVLGYCDSAKFDCTRSSTRGLYPTTRAAVPASSQPVLTTLHIPCTHHLHSSQPCTHRPHCSQPSDFLIAAPTNSVRAAGIGAAGKEKKRIFLCTRFPPRGEAGDVKIWGGRSPRLPLELVVTDFLIAAPTNSMRAVGIGAAGKEKKESFCARDSHLVVRLTTSRIGGGGGTLRGLLLNLLSPDF